MDKQKQLKVAIAGLGSRGLNTYAQCQKLFPQDMKIVAVAGPIESRRELAL